MLYRERMDALRSGHVAPVVIVTHQAGPDGWVAQVEALLAAIEAHPHAPVTVRLPGAALDHLVKHHRDLWAQVRALEIAWLAGGWSDPVLADLPMAAARLQLAREKTALDAAGINPSGLWLNDGWERTMATFALESGHPLVFVDSEILADPADRPGAFDRAGETVIVVPVAGEPTGSAGDGLATIRVEAPALGHFLAANPGRVTTPDRYLADHLPGRRLQPRVGVPERGGAVERFYRKLLRVVADHSERSAAIDLVLGLESREYTTGAGLGPEADLQLLEARKAVDRALMRGDGWVRVIDVDWDGDGTDEVQVETPGATLVVDAADGRIITWDDKTGAWPITSVDPPTLGVVVRQLTEAGAETAVAPMWVERRTQGRGEARLRLTDEVGGKYRLGLAGRVLSIEVVPGETDGVLLGPELPLRFEVASTRLRVDGGEWHDLNSATAVTGHRFRLTDAHHALLMSSPRPANLFVHPLGDSGIVMWLHWAATPGGEYQVTLEPQ